MATAKNRTIPWDQIVCLYDQDLNKRFYDYRFSKGIWKYSENTGAQVHAGSYDKLYTSDAKMSFFISQDDANVYFWAGVHVHPGNGALSPFYYRMPEKVFHWGLPPGLPGESYGDSGYRFGGPDGVNIPDAPDITLQQATIIGPDGLEITGPDDQGLWNEGYLVTIADGEYPVHFTVDGLDPTTANDVYTGPIVIPINAVIKAVAANAQILSDISTAIAQ